MTTITHIYECVDDVVAHMEHQAETYRMVALAERTHKAAAAANSRARAFEDAARMLRDSWIEEIDGDKHTATERGRKLSTKREANDE